MAGGRSVFSGMELQEWLVWLCSWTALHLASQNGHTETAMALVKAGADVHSKNKDGHGSALGLHARVFGLPQCGGGRSVESGMELQGWLVWLCRCTALYSASQNGHTETAMALVKAGADVHCTAKDGYGCSSCMLVSLVCHSAGASGPSTRGWSCRDGWFGCAVGRRCTRRRTTATRRRRWRCWRRAELCTARAREGTVRGGAWLGGCRASLL